MSRKVLVVDDEKLIVKGIRFSLEQDGMEVDCAYDGEEALSMAKEKEYDMILLDLMLPKLDGLSVCQQIREFSNVPIVMLTAKGEDMDKILGLEYGADDYITKPFEIKEVVARVAVQLRHAVADVPSKSGKAGENQTKAENDTGQGDTTNTYIAGPVKIEHRQLVLDRISRQLYVADNAVDGITKQEFAILELLMAHPRQVFAKEDIFEYAWDEPYIGETKTLDVHISNIRKKIKKLTDDEYIETVWGIGYKMKE